MSFKTMLSKNNKFQLIAIATCLFFALIATLQAEEKAKANPYYPNWGEITPAMKKSMDPNVMNNLMKMMMDPEKMMSTESCVQCHEPEDVARYEKDLGPMMEAMKPMMSMMNPMMGMMNPMMGPMMSMMNPMMAPMMGMMTPMMNPAMDMSYSMMSPMMGMVNPMMGPMMNPMGMMDPKQYEQWFNQWTESMKNVSPQPQSQSN